LTNSNKLVHTKQQGKEIMNGSISLADLERKWRVNRRTLYRWIRDSKLQSLRTPGGHYRIAEEEIARFEHEMLSRSIPTKRQTPGKK
jgi:excisionase family DNA binding protein